MTSKEMSWQAPEFVHYSKSAAWFAVLALVGAALVLYALWQKDFLTAVLFVLLFLTVFYFSRKRPKTLTIKLAAHGVNFSGVHLPWQKIQTFWIVYDPPEVKTLNFETAAYFNRILTLQLGDADPLEIRAFLLAYLPEELDREEQLSDKISRKLRF